MTKKNNNLVRLMMIVSSILIFQTSCVKNILEQVPTGDLPENAFWKSEADANMGLNGLYAAVRPCFDRDYYFDGQAEYTRARGTSATDGNLRLGDAYHNGNYNPTGYGAAFDKMFRYLYGAVNRSNYVIENTQKLIDNGVPGTIANYEQIIGEARFLRGLVYFRLISMWGDVPYLNKVYFNNSEVALQERIPMTQIKDSIMADFNYAFEKLPVSTTLAGRATKPSVLAFRGKLQLYWASWNRFGWPELENFKPDAVAATAGYTAAAADFKAVATNYGLTLYLNGDPGEIDELGKADKLPNYYYLFTPRANGNPEFIFAFNHGGTNSNQGEELMRDFSGRSHEGSQCWVSPRYEIADRYQLLTTGEFAPKLVPMNPTVAGSTARTALNSAVNPASYANRDYRMKSSIQWDYEMSVGIASLASTGWCPFIYQTWAVRVTIGGVNYTTYNTDGTNSGYVFRKFVRNYAGQGRSDGDFSYPVMRLADVYLMYAEATNAISGPQADAIGYINAIRRRGNLPGLKADKFASSTAFFDAIEQERIIELLGEGQRSFDLRRWRALERVWGAPGSAGVWRIDTYGANQQRYFQNTAALEYQQDYIFRIPPGERDRNPKLTQNIPWR